MCTFHILNYNYLNAIYSYLFFKLYTSQIKHAKSLGTSPKAKCLIFLSDLFTDNTQVQYNVLSATSPLLYITA